MRPRLVRTNSHPPPDAKHPIPLYHKTAQMSIGKMHKVFEILIHHFVQNFLGNFQKSIDISKALWYNI
jgi:hypothetical protein